jgi:hypothetical protein
MLRLFLCQKIADLGIRAVACCYGNEPGTAAVQFGLKLRLGHRSLLELSPPTSAVRMIRVSQENAGTKKGKQRGDQLGHCCRPPRLAMPGTALFRNSR